ncbi:MAG TPA: menaquinone biosynthesis decarboxylase [Bacteroidales bacterium]|nr:menaquinone biosynthesis decarboxylase [Bacteroidales bacterium]
MTFSGLADYVSYLDSSGDLCRVSCPVDPILEITEIADRMVKSGGKALLFEDTGTKFPLLINSLASDSRIAAALGRVSPENAGDEIISLFDAIGGEKGLWSKISQLPRMLKLLKLAPRKRAGRGICQEVITGNPDLSILPVMKCWPHDGGRFITLPLVHTRHPLTGKTNLGMYRMQVMGPDLTGMHWHRHKTGARHYQSWKEAGKRMPVTVTLGGDPVYTYSATAPMPENMDEYLLAGFLRGRRVEMVKCITNDLWIPADSDIVIEGYVDPSEELLLEGPFGDHTGFYSLADYYPGFHVTCITHRKNAVYPSTIVGVPPMEDAWIGKATEKIFLAPLKLAITPEISNLHMPVAGVAHNLVLVSIDKYYPGQGMKVINALFGAGQMMFSKYIIVLNSEVPLHDYRKVVDALFENVRFGTDLMVTRGPLDVLDHSSDTFSMGGKMGIDATLKLKEERNPDLSTVPLRLMAVEGIRNEVVTGIKTMSDLSLPLVIITVRKPAAGFDMRDLISSLPGPMQEDGTITVAVDDGTDTDDLSMIVWLVTGNSDPSRDIFKPAGGGLFIDATSKSGSLPPFPREWPNVVCSDAETIEKVDRRWSDYRTGVFIKSPSLKLFPLLQPGDAAVEKPKKIKT